MADPNDVYYDGFRTFSWLSDLIGLPIDQVNFLITQFTALGLAGLLRSSLNPVVASPASRHAFGLVIGLVLGYFSFGKQAMHLAGLPALCYVAMRTLDPRHMQRVVLVVALTYLSGIHFHRQMYDYASYTLDITGPLMVITQKVTSLAYSVHDGLTRKQDELSPLQRHYAVQYVLLCTARYDGKMLSRVYTFLLFLSIVLGNVFLGHGFSMLTVIFIFAKMPTALEYFSYVFQFQVLMAGPIIFYRDYIDFIHGRSQQLLKNSDEKISQPDEIVREPPPTPVVVKKLAASLACAVIFVTLLPSYPMQKVKDDEFLQNTSTGYKYWYLIMASMLIRFKYYHAWLFADAICNNSGLGFNGYGADGTARWDLVSNVDVLQFETALSLRDSIEAWNKGTNKWLRMMVYERAKKNKVIFTYALSALWHGFYPGYYLTFANGAFFTVASRNVRRIVRPYFLTSKTKKVFYDALTMVTTRLFLAYITFSFILLEFKPSIILYLNMYLAPHLLGMSAILVLPMFPRARESNESGSGGGSRPHHHHHNHRTEKVLADYRAMASVSAGSNGHVHKGK